jgi:hypothetical protein
MTKRQSAAITTRVIRQESIDDLLTEVGFGVRSITDGLTIHYCRST